MEDSLLLSRVQEGLETTVNAGLEISDSWVDDAPLPDVVNGGSSVSKRGAVSWGTSSCLNEVYLRMCVGSPKPGSSLSREDEEGQRYGGRRRNPLKPGSSRARKAVLACTSERRPPEGP